MNNNTILPGVMLQWTKGDKIGNVEKIASHDSEWTMFQSGSKIATSLINEFMIPIEGEPLDFRTSQVLEKDSKGPIGPTGSIGVTGYGPSSNLIENPPGIMDIPEKMQKNSPIKTLFNKLKKTDVVNLNLTFEVKIPTVDVFDIISTSFDENEVLVELDLYILNQISQNTLNVKLRSAVEDLILTFYKKNI